MIVLLLLLISVILLLVCAWRRDAGSPLIALFLGMIPILVFLVAARCISGPDWSFRPSAYWFIGIFVGLPMILLAASLVVVLAKHRTPSGKASNRWQSAKSIVMCLLALMVYSGLSLAFGSLFDGVTTISLSLGFLGVVVIVGGYILLVSYGYLLHCVLLNRARMSTDVDFIIVHGLMLEDDEVTPQLSSRLDAAIAVYNSGGGRATIVPSGGWTGDDITSEAEAMVNCLLERGIPAEQIVPEDQSMTTRENLENSKEIVQIRSRSANPRVAFITSDYHVYRTGLIARAVGLNAHGFGSHTPAHLLPTAIVRELAAVFWMHKLWHSIPILAVTLYYQVAVLPSERY